MVGTRNTALEVPIDANTRNWVENHVTSLITPLQEQLQNMSAQINQILIGQQYNSRGEGTSRFSRMSKLEFPKFYGDDTHGEAVAWDVYEAAILQRFGAINKDPMAELKNLKYETTVKEYQSQFEKLMNQVDITESQAISMFIGGLPASIELKVRMFKPRSLTDAFSLAGLQEATIAALKQRNAPILTTPSGWNANRSVTYPSKSTTTTLALPAPNNQTVTKYPASSVSTPRKMLSQKEFAEKRAKSQCFYCDKKYVPGHKCEGQMFTLEITGQEEEECLEEEEEEEESDMIAYELSNQTPQSSPHISLNALSGIPTHNTMRVRGHVLKQLLHILMDSGISVVISQYMVKAFQWKLQGIVFETDVMLLPLGGCKMVLGVQWLSTLGTIQWNFKDLVMKFQYEGQKVVLRGTHKSELAWLNGRQMSKYPPSQKDTIEAMVKKLLDSGVLRPSNSPFSSLIVMVKKKDGSWRMCIDYRHINKHTVKDKFPIPVIEELIDELQGAQVFSKLDLRSEYHQIRMCESDVYKTAFKTHEGHYEFVVMPFGLTNAQSTFQALINYVFKPFLRKFTLVFFDDILVYSPSIPEHIGHLRMVLQVMRDHNLFAKQSKCVFGTTQVEYSGHVISAQGVSTDPSKIKVMQEWPVPTTLKQLRGFLGLTGYYIRFIKGYASISQPLTLLLKKNAFQWNPKAQEAFEKLQQAMIQSLVLAFANNLSVNQIHAYYRHFKTD
ncbi:putative mitochondrial protein [Tanacetum coccineum]